MRWVRRCLETTGLSVVADDASAVELPANHRSGKASLALVRDKVENHASWPRQTARDREHAGPVIVLTTAAHVEAARGSVRQQRVGLHRPVQHHGAGRCCHCWCCSVVVRGQKRRAAPSLTSASRTE